MVELEYDLSSCSGDHSVTVGVFRNAPIQCSLLHKKLFKKSDYLQLKELGKSEAEIEELVREMNQRVVPLKDICCGYAGWLMSNPAFVEEFESLVTRNRVPIGKWGTSRVGLLDDTMLASGELNPGQEPGWKEYEAEVLEFCVRWRLVGLAGPRIPVPMQPMMSGSFPLSIIRQLLRAGGLFNWPDTFPVYAREELRDLLTGALQSKEVSEHLSEWHQIISSENRAKNQISKYARQFRLQHFWKLLVERHASTFDGGVERLEQAFAKYLGVSAATIKADRRTLRNKLGVDWACPTSP